MPSQRALTDAQVAQYHRDGYVVAAGTLDAAREQGAVLAALVVTCALTGVACQPAPTPVRWPVSSPRIPWPGATTTCEN